MKKRKLKIKIPRPNRVGDAPGTITYIGPERDLGVDVELISYNLTEYNSYNINEIGSIDNDRVNWYNMDGIHESETISKFGEAFDLHHLMLEDVANTDQRPKTEEYENCIFVSIKMLNYDEEEKQLNSEQVSLVLGQNWVITFQEKTGDVFGPVRDRITHAKGRIRNMSNDYLFYALIDCIIDNYFLAIEQIGLEIEDLEDEVFDNPDQDSLMKIQQNKRLLLTLRKAVYPLRESISKLQRNESSLITDKTKMYLSDVYDHSIQIIETIESQREINSGLKDMYLSGISHRMNLVMQTLTIISTIFIPLTFLAGIYGMNFENIPELKWSFGYPMFWIICGALGIVLLIVFKKKKWL